MKKTGIGYEKYKDFIDQGLYYVDKTLLIKDILEKGGQATLITRPRGFGKTLALSMLRTFFELEYDGAGTETDNRRYFEGMKIMDCGEEILSHLGQYPVIMLSLKSAKQPDFQSSFAMLRKEIISEFSRHDYLGNSDALSREDKEKYSAFLRGEIDWEERRRSFSSSGDEEREFRNERVKYASALKELCVMLKKHHGRNVVILLDEYDVPLETAWYGGFFDDMKAFIRSLFESAVKTNDALAFAVITGCLRISRESIFTGMNNLRTVSVMDDDFAEDFGFEPYETEQMLADYGLSDRLGEVRDWYDGYLFGKTEIYNPWSVVNYVAGKVYSGRRFPAAYWSNTSSNSIIRDLVERADDRQKEELEHLLSGGTIEKKVHEEITYGDIYESEDNLWNFLFLTGYMRKVSERLEGENLYVTMRIPNREVSSIYSNQISAWFEKRVKAADRTALHRAVLDKDADTIAEILSEMLSSSISTFDSSESFYHGYLLSMLTGMKNYIARSNREEGDGRPDIVLYPQRPNDPAYIFEIKVRRSFREMQEGAEEAIRQIEDRKYEEEIYHDGYAGSVSYGVCFCKKACLLAVRQ